MNIHLRIILKTCIILFLLVLLILFFWNNKQDQESCLSLSKNLDKQDNSLYSIWERCDLTDSYKYPLFVGGILIDISRTQIYNYYDYKLTFEGIEKNLTISIRTKEEVLPYEVGKFYKFDLNKECKLYPSVYNGFFYDPNLDKLIQLNC